MMLLNALLPKLRLPSELAQVRVTGMTLDSRQVAQGNVFVAIPGDAVDGRHYIDQALQAGASVVLAEQAGLQQQHDRVIAIPDLKQQLGSLAARYYGTADSHMRLIGVTGTNGKTSVASFLQNAFDALDEPCALLGTLGAVFADYRQESHRTTPDVLSMHRLLADFSQRGARACVMEASSHALAQGRLDSVPIGVAVFTNLSRDHLDYHGNMDAYFAAKASLFTRPDVKLAVINQDDKAGRKLLSQLAGKRHLLTYGHDEQADIQLLSSRANRDGLHIRLLLDTNTVEVRLPLFGEFNAGNVAAVAAVLYGLGHEAPAIETALNALKPVTGRMQPVQLAGAAQQPQVLVDYAHTPDALEKALQAVRTHFSGHIHCVFGCGGHRDTGKRPQMAAVAERLADKVIVTSDNPRDEKPAEIVRDVMAGFAHPEAVTVEVDRPKAVQLAIKQAASRDLVLIAGKGHETYQEVDGQYLPMDDKELAMSALQQRQRVGGHNATA